MVRSGSAAIMLTFFLIKTSMMMMMIIIIIIIIIMYGFSSVMASYTSGTKCALQHCNFTFLCFEKGLTMTS
jgi:hypothetical protein